MPANPKCLREVDKKYLAWIRKQPCIITCQKAEPHHVKSVGSGGSDLYAIPLSHKLHVECHSIGRATFQEKYGVCFKDEIIRLLIKYRKT